jgi:hypothetical protein
MIDASTIFKYTGKKSIGMAYKSEEDLELWFAIEKERLSDEFLKGIDQNKDNIPRFRARFDAEMKKLIAKYNSEYYKLLAYLKKNPKKE